jgi:hypothetical protein
MVDIGNHSSIYHLHIPRTGGIYVKNQLLEKYKDSHVFASHYSKLELDSLHICKYVSGHFGTTPIEHLNDPLVFTVLRNPVDRFLSYYKYTRPFFYEDMLDLWLYDKTLSKLQSNTQLKFITNPIDIDQYNKNLVSKETVNNNWFIGQEEDMDKAKYFIDNNLILFTESLDEYFNTDGVIRINKSGKRPEITQSQYDRIVELNRLDIELYEYALRSKKH